MNNMHACSLIENVCFSVQMIVIYGWILPVLAVLNEGEYSLAKEVPVNSSIVR